MISQPQFLTNAQGERIAVMLPLADYEYLLEDIEDLAALVERRDELTIDHDEVIRRLKADGLL